MKASVILYKSKNLATGEHPLMLVLRDGIKMKKVSLKVSLPASRWNDKKNCYKPTPIPEGMSEDKILEIQKKDAEIISLIKGYRSKIF